MTLPKEDPLEDINALRKEIEGFDFTAPIEEQKKQVQQIAKKVIEINNQLPIGTVAELGGDTVSIVNCAAKPVDPIACLWAIVAILDIIKVARQKKLK